MSAFFFGKNGTFAQELWYRFFSSVSSFCKINGNVSSTDYASGIRLSDCSKLAKRHNLPIWRYRQFFFDVVLFLFSSLATGSSFISTSLMVLELRELSFIRDLQEIRKSAIHEGRLGIPNLVWISLLKCYYMLQKAKVAAFTVFESLRENQQEGG